MTIMKTNILVFLHNTLGYGVGTIIIFGITFYFAFIRKRRTSKMMSMLQSFNQMPAIPIIGSLYLLMGNPRERTAKVIKAWNTYETPFVVWLMNTPLVCITEHEDTQEILNTSHHVEYLGTFEKFFRNSIQQSQGEKWRKSRQLASAAFSSTMMREYFTTVNEHSAILAKELEPLSDTDEVIDIKSYISMSNLNSTLRNFTGYKMYSSRKERVEFIDAISKAIQMESDRYTVPFLLPKIMYEAYLFLFRKRYVYDTMQNLAKKIVRERLATYNTKTNTPSEGTDQDTVATGPKLYIDLLLQRYNTDADITKEHVEDEVFGIIFGSLGTTSETVCFLSLMLAIHQEAQQKVYDEIEIICGDTDQEFQKEDLKKLVYLEQCVNETLRKFTIVPVDFRTHHEDIMLKNGQVIPAGCLVLLALYKIHHNKKFFPNADNWDPRHFDRERITQWRQSFFPFGSGPRLCVGSKYAMMSIKIQLVHLLRRYRLTTEMKMRDIHIVFGMVTQNDSGYRLKLHSRVKNERSDMSA
uniref:Cytochrome P450 3638F2 n=1 Tax=Maconellicoccus hirsutus TaxID=177089 RepID=A0AAT9UTK2_MACHI